MNQNLWLLIISLGLCSGIILIDRFVTAIPDWLAIVFIIIALVAFIVFVVKNKKYRK